MESSSSLSSLSYTKIAIGIGFSILGGLYSYYYFFKSKANKYTLYINDYLKAISSMICNSKGAIDESILCHINHIKNEIISQIRKSLKDGNQLDADRRASRSNEKEYNNLYRDANTLNESYIKEAIEYIQSSLEPIDLTNWLNYLLLTNDKLINLLQNKRFKRLIQYPSIELPQGLTDKQIDDCFFYASVSQIEYDKILTQFNQSQTINEEVTQFYQLNLFKQKFKDDFYIKYGFDCKYLPDLMQNKEGLNVEELNVLINKITY